MSLLTRNKDKIDLIISEITSRLSNRETFGRASAMDRFDAITINGYLTVAPSYCYVGIDINNESELDDPNKIVNEFVTTWCKNDDPKSVRLFQQFIKDGERWGWE